MGVYDRLDKEVTEERSKNCWLVREKANEEKERGNEGKILAKEQMDKA